MSDPAKSADEIEDVLASIRRLVSEAGPVSARESAPTTPENPGKLVLTPAQRVAEPDDPWLPVPPAAEVPTPAIADDAADAPAGKTGDEGDDPAWGLEDRLSDWGEIEDSAQEAIEDAIAESGHADAPQIEMPVEAEDVSEADDAFDMPDLARLDGVIDGELPRDAYEPETGDADWPDRGADSALRDLAAARFGQTAAAGVPEADSAPPEEPSEPSTNAAPEKAPTPSERGAPASAVSTIRPAEADTPRRAEHAMTEPEAEDTDEAPRPEPGFTPVFSRRMDRAAAAEDGTEVSGIAAGDIEDLGEDPSPFSFPDAEDGILDEETLREIVADVVRQELQGALGQRITRNVRKMVRREIRIALAAEDLE